MCALDPGFCERVRERSFVFDFVFLSLRRVRISYLGVTEGGACGGDGEIVVCFGSLRIGSEDLD